MHKLRKHTNLNLKSNLLSQKIGSHHNHEAEDHVDVQEDLVEVRVASSTAEVVDQREEGRRKPNSLKFPWPLHTPSRKLIHGIGGGVHPIEPTHDPEF